MSESAKKHGELKHQEIEQLLKSGNILERLKAIDLLAEAKQIDRLISLLFSESWHLRERVQEVLGKLITEKELETLLPLLDEKMWYVRAGVIKVLGIHEDTRVFDHIYPHLKERNEVVRANAAVALARFVVKEPQLKEKLSKDDIIVIENALRELNEFELLEKFMSL